MRLRVLATHCARGLHLRVAPSKTEGAGKTGCALHPRSRVQLRTKNAHTSIQVQRRASGLPCAVALRLIRALPGERLFCHRRPGETVLESLTPAPRRQDHTTSPYASCALVCHACRVHRIPPRVRDDREPPLVTGETRGVKSLICPTREAEYFCAKGWTDFW